MSNDLSKWDQITTDEAYKLSMAEFRGMTIQALKDIREDIRGLQDYNNNTRYISLLLAGIAGIASGIFGSSINK